MSCWATHPLKVSTSLRIWVASGLPSRIRMGAFSAQGEHLERLGDRWRLRWVDVSKVIRKRRGGYAAPGDNVQQRLRRPEAGSFAREHFRTVIIPLQLITDALRSVE
jgi:hypothetical protein